jgi:hypothetical protein
MFAVQLGKEAALGAQMKRWLGLPGRAPSRFAQTGLSSPLQQELRQTFGASTSSRRPSRLALTSQEGRIRMRIHQPLSRDYRGA